MTQRLHLIPLSRHVNWIMALLLKFPRGRTVATLVPWTPILFLPFALAGKELVESLIEQEVKGVLISSLIMGCSLGLTLTLGYWQYTSGTVRLVHLAHQEIDRQLFQTISSVPYPTTSRAEILDRLEILRTDRMPLTRIVLSLHEALLVVSSLVVTSAILIYVEPRFGFISLSMLILAWVHYQTAARWEEPLSNEIAQRRLAVRLYDIGTTPGPAKEIRVSGQEVDLITLHKDISGIADTASFNRTLKKSLVQLGSWGLYSAVFASLLYIILGTSSNSTLTPGTLFLLVLVMAQLGFQVESMASTASNIKKMISRIDDILGVIDQHSLDSRQMAPPNQISRGIELRDVHFAYTEHSEFVLKGIDLYIPPSTVVAIVGDNGAGKSTLVNLLAGLYSPTSGSIYVDGIDLEDICRQSWFSRLSIVCQDFVKFDMTVRENVGVGRLQDIDNIEGIAVALNLADATSFVNELRNGMESQLSTLDSGIELSEGQWQKLAFARSRMRNRPLLLLLDEPTASIDAIAEQRMLRRYFHDIRDQARNTGTIAVVVSHRYSTVQMADYIVMLRHGRILETGTHEKLMNLNGAYARTYDEQAKSYESTHDYSSTS